MSAGFPKLNPLDMIRRTYSAIGAAIPHRTQAERDQAFPDLARPVRSDRLLVPIEGQYAFEETPTLIALLGCVIMGRHIITIYPFNLPAPCPRFSGPFHSNFP